MVYVCQVVYLGKIYFVDVVGTEMLKYTNDNK